jgi:rhodanese-related sulfurtransferase
MKKIHFFTIFLIIIMLSMLSTCQSTPITPNNSATPKVDKVVKVNNGSYTDVSVTELKTLMENKDFILVNVHIPFEGNLPQTDLSIPFDTIGQNLDKLPADKTAKIVLYCRSGRMSTIAAQELVKLGYTNIWNLDGGMAAWEQAGLPIER